MHGPPLESPNAGEFLRSAHVDRVLPRCLRGASPPYVCTMRARQRTILILMAPWERLSDREGAPREGWASLGTFLFPVSFVKEMGRCPRRTPVRRGRPRPRPRRAKPRLPWGKIRRTAGLRCALFMACKREEPAFIRCLCRRSTSTPGPRAYPRRWR